MTFLALNLVLAIVWLFLTGSFGTTNLIFGFAIGYGVIRVAAPYLGSRAYLQSVRGSVRFLFAFAYEVIKANLQLARDVLKPEMPFKPGILRYETEGLTPTQVVVLTNMICLTPGSLSIDMDDNGRVLYIHSVYADDPKAFLASVERLAELIKGVHFTETPAGEVSS